MPKIAKILAGIINASRAAYVASAEGMVGGGIQQSIMKAIGGSKVFAPSPFYKAMGKGGMNEENVMKMIQEMIKEKGG